MTAVTILHRPFDPARVPVRRGPMGPIGWENHTRPADWRRFPYGAQAGRGVVPGRRLSPQELAGLGSFLKKAAKVVTSVARAPIKLVSPQLAKNLEKIDNKLIDNADAALTKVNDAAKSVGKWAQKNAKWIIIAAAVAVTIYTMGTGAGFMAKFTAGLAKAKALAVSAGTWMKAKGLALVAGLTKLQGGAKFGELEPQEVEALAEANGATGENLVPPEVLSNIGAAPEAEAPSLMTQAMPALETLTKLATGTRAQMPNMTPGVAPSAMPNGPGAGGGGGYPGNPGQTPTPLPSWVIPAAVGAGALVLVLALK